MKTHDERSPSIRRPKRTVLPNYSHRAACALPRTGGWKSQPPAQHQRHLLPVSPFVAALSPAPPGDADESRLPCREHRFTTLQAPARNAANFYLGHTPRLLRLKYSGDQPERRGTNPGSKSPSCVSHRLRPTNHVAIPSYREESSRHVRRFRAATVSRSHRCGFQGTERGSIPLPVRENRSLLGSVFRQTYRQALTGLSWLSSLLPPHFSAVTGLIGPVSLVAKRELPTPARLSEVVADSRTPWTGLRVAQTSAAPHPLCALTA